MPPRTHIYRSRSHRSERSLVREQALVILAVLALLIFLKVWQKVNVDHQIRRNGKLEQELISLRGENALLEVKIDDLRSRQRMDRLEANQLNLVPVPTINLREKTILDVLSDKLEDWQR